MADANSGSRALAAASQLEKIGFVDFTVDLVKGVYEVIVNASMEQLEAYAELVTKVSKSLEEYQDEVLGPDETEKQEKAENYITEVLGFKKQDTYTLTDDQATALREHLAGISVQEDEQNKGIDDYITVIHGYINILAPASLFTGNNSSHNAHSSP
jgi:ABC-type nitrate/sulfonate/bicarbonate transport system substrate-binding protein